MSTSTPASAIDLALRLTLLDLLLRPVGNWFIRPLVLGLAAVMLLRSAWLREPGPWLALAVLTGMRVVLDWPLSDNHAYLLSYWCLAVGLALMLRDPAAVLAGSARLLIGLVFAFASVWKIALSGDYVSGTFFPVTMLTDPRFEGFTQVVAGLDMAEIEALRGLLEAHRDLVPAAAGDGLPLPDRFLAVAAVAAWWNLAINAALAVAYLWPWRAWPAEERAVHARHLLLLVYCVVTYAIATVDGFGWLLLAMGVAQCSAEQRRLRAAYVGVFVLVLLYREVPWAEAVILPALQLTGLRLD